MPKTSFRCLLMLGVWLAIGRPTAAQPVFEVLHFFPDGPGDGMNIRPLVQGTDGTLYGATYSGGGSGCGGIGCGTIFQMAPDGTGYTVLYSFTSDTGEQHPTGLIQAMAGTFYGTTSDLSFEGRTSAVFRLTP